MCSGCLSSGAQIRAVSTIRKECAMLRGRCSRSTRTKGGCGPANGSARRFWFSVRIASPPDRLLIQTHALQMPPFPSFSRSRGVEHPLVTHNHQTAWCRSASVWMVTHHTCLDTSPERALRDHLIPKRYPARPKSPPRCHHRRRSFTIESCARAFTPGRLGLGGLGWSGSRWPRD